MDGNMASPLASPRASPRQRSSAITGDVLSPTAKGRGKSAMGSEEHKFLEIQSIAASLHRIAAELNEVQPNSPGGKRGSSKRASTDTASKGLLPQRTKSKSSLNAAVGRNSARATAEPVAEREDTSASAESGLDETATRRIPSRPKRNLRDLVDRPEDSSMDGESSDSVVETASEKSFASDLPEIVFEQGEETEDFDAAQWYGTIIDQLDKLKVKDECASMLELRKRYIRTDPRRADDMERLQTLSTKRFNEGENQKREMALVALDLEEAMSKLLIQLNDFDHSLQRTAEEVEQHRVMMEKRKNVNAGISFDGMKAYRSAKTKTIWDEDSMGGDSDKWDGEVKVKERPMKKIAQSKAGVLLGVISTQQNDVTEQAVKAAQLTKRLHVMREAHAHMHGEGGEGQEEASKEVTEAIQNLAQQIQRRKELEQKHAHAKMLAELAAPSAAYAGLPEAPQDVVQEVAMLKSRVRDLDAEMAQFGGGQGQASASIAKLMGHRKSMRRAGTDASMGGVDSIAMGASKSMGGRRRSRARFEETFREPGQPTMEELQEQVNKALMRRATLISEKSEQQDVLTEMQGERGIMQQSFFEADRLRAKWAAIGLPAPPMGQQPVGFGLQSMQEEEEEPPDAYSATTQEERAEWQLRSAEVEKLLGVPPPASLEQATEMRVTLEQDMARKRTQVRSLMELLTKVTAKQDMLQQSRDRQQQAQRELEAAQQQRASQEARGAGSGGGKKKKTSGGDGDDADKGDPPPDTPTIAPEHLQRRRSSLKGLLKRSRMLALVMRPPPGTVVAEDGSVSIAGLGGPSRQSRTSSVQSDHDGQDDEDDLMDMGQLRGMVPQDDGQEGSAELVAHILSLQANLEELHFQQVDYEAATTYVKKRGGTDGLTGSEWALVMSMIDGDQKENPHGGAVTKADLAACMVRQAVLRKRLQELRRRFRQKVAAEKAEAKQAAAAESDTGNPMALPTEGEGIVTPFSVQSIAAKMKRTLVRSSTLPVATVDLFMDASPPKIASLSSLSSMQMQKSTSETGLSSGIGSGDRPLLVQRTQSLQSMAHRLSSAAAVQRRLSGNQPRSGLFETVVRMRKEVMPDVMRSFSDPQSYVASDGVPPRLSNVDILAAVSEEGPVSAPSGRGSSLASLPPGGPMEEEEWPLTPVFRRVSTRFEDEVATKRVLLEEESPSPSPGASMPAVAAAQSLPGASQPFVGRISSEGSGDGPAVRTTISAPEVVRKMLMASRSSRSSATTADNNRALLVPGVSPKRRKRRRSMTHALLKVDDSDDDEPEEGKEAPAISASAKFAAVRATLSENWKRVSTDARAASSSDARS